MDAIWPLAFFIRNHAEHEIVGISFRWGTTSSNGKTRVMNISVNHPGALIGMKPLDPWMVGKTSIVNPGALQFFCYPDAVRQCVKNAGYRARYPEINYGIDLKTEEVERLRSSVLYDKTRMLRVAVSISVSMDAVIFDHGGFIRDNKTLYFEVMSGSIKAEFNFRTALRDADADGKTDPEIIGGFLDALPAERPQFRPPISPGERFSSGEEAFRTAYLSKQYILRQDLERRREVNKSDSEILSSYRSRKESDYKELRRITSS